MKLEGHETNVDEISCQLRFNAVLVHKTLAVPYS